MSEKVNNSNQDLIGVESFDDISVKKVSDQFYSSLNLNVKSFTSSLPFLKYNHIIHRKIPRYLSNLDSDKKVILPSHDLAAGIVKSHEAEVIVLVHGLDNLIYDNGSSIGKYNFKRGILNLDYCDKIVCLSKRAKKQLSRYRISKERSRVETKVIEQAFQKGKFYKEEKDPEKIAVPNNYILYTGSLNPRKNPKLAIDVADEIDRNLVIAGKPQGRKQEIEDYISEKGMQDKVNFTGFISVEDLRRVYSNASVYLHPSLMEGFGRTPVEAAACGTKPVIHEDLGCAPVLEEVSTEFDSWEIDEVSKKVEENFNEEVEYEPKTWEEFASQFREFVGD